MASSLNGTGITFSDATTQSTANNLPANSTNVLAINAGVSVGDVGTYAFLGHNTANATNLTFGSTLAGSALRSTGIAVGGGLGGATFVGGGGLSTPSGTWRAMGSVDKSGASRNSVTLWLRIS